MGSMFLVMQTGEPTVDSTSPPRRRRWRIAALVASLVVLILVAYGITTVTGLPGPGPIRRYPVADLDALTVRINHVFPGCEQLHTPPLAYVDTLRSRVILRASWTLPVLKLSASDRAMIEAPPLNAGSGYPPICGGPG
jgi:hypothetical protein